MGLFKQVWKVYDKSCSFTTTWWQYMTLGWEIAPKIVNKIVQKLPPKVSELFLEKNNIVWLRYVQICRHFM